MRTKKLLSLLLVLLMVLGLTACQLDQQTVEFASEAAGALLEEQTDGEMEVPPESPPDQLPDTTPAPAPQAPIPAEDGVYTSKEDVALYLHTYGRLPDNFISKKQARALGWEGGGLDSYADGMCIGGDRFGNYEGRLPDADGRTWTECDIDTLHASSRGAKRIVFSNDGLIYYTEDHYETFELLFGEE